MDLSTFLLAPAGASKVTTFSTSGELAIGFDY